MDYYEVLGVSNDADEKTIKKAYHILALKFHPDKKASNDGSAKFQAIQEAYEMLSDPEERSNYDRTMLRGAVSWPTSKPRMKPVHLNIATVRLSKQLMSFYCAPHDNEPNEALILKFNITEYAALHTKLEGDIIQDRFSYESDYIIRQAYTLKRKLLPSADEIMTGVCIKGISAHDAQSQHRIQVTENHPIAQALLNAESMLAARIEPANVNKALVTLCILLARYSCSADGRAYPPIKADIEALLNNLNEALNTNTITIAECFTIINATFNYDANQLTQAYQESNMPTALLSFFYKKSSNPHHEAIGLFKQHCLALADACPEHQSDIDTALAPEGALARIVDWHRDGTISAELTESRRALNGEPPKTYCGVKR